VNDHLQTPVKLQIFVSDKMSDNVGAFVAATGAPPTSGSCAPRRRAAGQAFLADVAQGRVPRELRAAGGDVDLEIDDRRVDGLGPRLPPPRAAPPPARTDFAAAGAPATKVQLLFPNSPPLAVAVPLRATVGDLRTVAGDARPDLAWNWLEFHRRRRGRCSTTPRR
jgi:hypothetical protein